MIEQKKTRVLIEEVSENMASVSLNGQSDKMINMMLRVLVDIGRQLNYSFDDFSDMMNKTLYDTWLCAEATEKGVGEDGDTGD